MPRTFIPFGDLKPDAREFRNDGLCIAKNVFPFSQSYLPSQYWDKRKATALTGTPTGFWAHPSALAWYGYYGSDTKLYELSSTAAADWTETDKTRLVGGNYAAAATTGWQGASFGDAVVMTNYTDDPQLLTSPAAANFVKLATSAGGTAGTGMDPKARFAAPIRGNMFLAYLNLPSALIKPDGVTELAATSYPNYVCWSQTDNVRVYGSFTATPSFVGTGYQALNYDLGYITGLLGGQYGLVFMQRGIVRIDGPPYEFRPIVQGIGCQYPNSAVRFDDDVYFWGPAGPMVLRGGEGPAESLTRGRLSRALTDRYTSCGEPVSASLGGLITQVNEFAVAAAADTAQLSGTADNLTRTVWWAYVSNIIVDVPPILPTRILIYHVDEDRFTWQGPCITSGADRSIVTYFLRNPPTTVSALSWRPGRDLACLGLNYDGIGWYPMTPASVTPTVSSNLVKGYVQFDPDNTTRITRVRPIYCGTLATASLTVYSKNRTTDTATPAGPYTGPDTHGWIVTPTTYKADWHRMDITIGSASTVEFFANHAVKEMDGLEVEYEVCGKYSA